MKAFWYVFWLGIILYLYLIFVEEKYEFMINLSSYSLIGLLAFSLEKSKDKKPKIET
ncbi:MAG: hypothetical protein QW197_02185 [Candidatus Aenigmatarchaeota archaeon]